MIATDRWTRRFAAIFAILTCVGSAWSPADAMAGVAWHESYEAAQSASHSSQRPILVIFTANWCEACQHLDSRLWANPEAAALVGACYEPVVVDVDSDPALARRLGISHIPSACVMDGNDRLLTTFDLPPTASGFVAQAAQALHATAATAITPATTIAAQPSATVVQPEQRPALAASAAVTQPAPAAPADGRYAASSRFAQQAPQQPITQQQATPQMQPPAAFSGTAGQPISPATTAAAPAQTPPWLSAAPATSTPQAATPPSAVPPAAPTAAPSLAPQQGYSLYPTTPSTATPSTAAQAYAPQGSYASATPPQTMPPQTLTPYPTPPAAVDSAAMATDRAEEKKEEPQTNSFLSTLQKPFAFMMPKSEPDEEEESAADLANAPTPYPVGLDGYCPVTLAEQASWTEGRAQWGVQHRGRTYLFAGANEQQRFLANPDRYAPALSGDDPVVAFEAGKQIPGQRRYGVTYQARIYLFSSLETRSRFAANPQAYASRVRLAENRGAAGGTMLR